MERISSRFIAPPIFIKSTELVANHDIFEYRQSPCHEGWLIVWCKNDEDEEEEELIINSISSRGGRIRRRWKMGDCFLWNSTTFESIMLPSLYSFFEDDPYPGPYSCILSSPPTSNNNNSMVFFTFSNGDIGVQDLWFLLFCHPGDKQWRKQEYSLFNAFFLFCFRGTKLPYIMAISDHIHVIGKLEPQISISSFEVKNSSLHPAEGEKIACSDRINYVECSYELFKIVRAYHYDKGSSFRRERLLYIKISKLDLRAPPPSPPSWVKVENMGNHVLFLGDNTVASFSAAELGLTKGCVYFTERTEDNLYKFDLEDDSIYVHPLPPYSYSSEEEEEEEEDPPLMPPLSLSSLQDWVRLVDGRSGSNDEEGAEKTTLPASDQVVVDYNYANIVQPPTTATSPHLVFLRRECPVWNFIDPMHNNHKYHSEIPLLDDATIHFSKGGWLLMSRGKTNIFFFNPFTRVTICLPDLEKYYMFFGISFSSLPTSPDCVIFGIAGQREGHVCISISRGDDSWFYNTELPSQEEHLVEEFKVSFNNPVFLNGVFYCIDKYGTLGVYEKQHNVCKWKVLDKPERPSTNGDIYMSFLVECQGELLSVFLGHLGEDVWVFRLDLSNMNWVEVKSLQKHMLFISHTSSISAVAPNSMMENKIFFARLGRGDKILYYCLETSRYYCFGSQHSAEDFYGTKTHLNCSWIEPNWSDNAGQELDWNNV